MKLQTLDEVEHSIGGRPSQLAKPKVRMSFYMLQSEADQLKAKALCNDLTISQIMRSLARSYLLHE